jgi:hypothetical protein
MNRMRKITSAFIAGEVAEASPVIGSSSEMLIKTKAQFGGIIRIDATGIDPNGYYTFEIRQGDIFHVFTDIKPTVVDGLATFEMWVDIDKVLSKTPSDVILMLKELRSAVEVHCMALNDETNAFLARVDAELLKHGIRFTD